MSILWNQCFPVVHVSSGNMTGFWIVSLKAKNEQTKGRKFHPTMSDLKFSEVLDTELKISFPIKAKYPRSPIWQTKIKVLEALWISELFSQNFIIVITILLTCHSLKAWILYQIFVVVKESESIDCSFCCKSLYPTGSSVVALLTMLTTH